MLSSLLINKMARIIKYTVLIISIIGTSLFIAVHYRTIWYSWYSTGSAYYVLILPCLIIYVFLLSRRLTFIENLMHELTHLLFAAISFQKINGLYVTSTSGVVDTISYRKSTMVTLSPYFFPLTTILLICLFTIVDYQYSRHIVIISYSWYLAVTLKHLVRRTGELSSTGTSGFLAVLILNFWMSYFILSRCYFIDIDIKETLKAINDGIK